jgi:hypothetical protein
LKTLDAKNVEGVFSVLHFPIKLGNDRIPYHGQPYVPLNAIKLRNFIGIQTVRFGILLESKPSDLEFYWNPNRKTLEYSA